MGKLFGTDGVRGIANRDLTPDLAFLMGLAAAVALLLLVFLQRWIHTHLHGVSLLLTGRPEWAVIVYAVILFPGVFLHEASHWLAATLTGVRTGGVSLMPRRRTQ